MTTQTTGEAKAPGLSEAAIAWLAERRLDIDLALRLGVYSQAGNRAGGELIVFPFVREGKTVNRKYRPLAEKRFWQDKDPVKGFFNEDVLRDDTLVKHPLIITEGECDAIAAIQSGYVRTVSMPDGAPDKPLGLEDSAKYEWLDGLAKLLSLERVPTVILAADGDAAGANLLHDLALRLGRFRCKYLVYPMARDGKRRLKDLNEVLAWYGPKGVELTIARAQWVKVKGVYRMSELPPMPQAPTFKNPLLPASRYNVRLGDWCVVTGIPSKGKTSFVNDLCCRLATAYNFKVAIASFEQAPQTDHRRNLRTWFHRKPVIHQTPEELDEADRWIDRHFVFLVPDDEQDPTLEWLFGVLEAAVVQHGCSLVVVDPWNELEHQPGRDESLTLYVGRAIRMMKRFARRFMVHFIVVAHPTKMQPDKATGTFRAPTLYDISDSANWANKADVGVVVHRWKEDNVEHSTIEVVKSRYHDDDMIGPPGVTYVQYLFPQRRFEVIEPDAMAGHD